VSFTGKFVPEELGGKGLGPFAGFMLRVVLAGAATALVVWVAAAAMLFTTAPAYVSLIVEPLSLLLLPGLAVGVYVTGPHELDPKMVVEGSVIFYFVCFLVGLEWRAFRGRVRRRA
jgi:hypothetical protein